MGNILYKYLDINGAIMMLHHRSLMYANATTIPINTSNKQSSTSSVLMATRSLSDNVPHSFNQHLLFHPHFTPNINSGQLLNNINCR